MGGITKAASATAEDYATLAEFLIAANGFEPGVGAHWHMAWDKR